MELKRRLSRRHFLQGGMGGVLLSLFFSKPWRARAHFLPGKAAGGSGSIAQRFEGEELGYEIGFWFFRRVALGKLTFKEANEKGRYVATLHAETLGLFGWLSHYRADTYSSTVEEAEGGSRLRSLQFEEKVTAGNRVDKRITRFDHAQRRWITAQWEKDGTMQRIEGEFPSGEDCNDFVTASYNFRYGAYGAVERGKIYRVPAFSKKGANRYDVTVDSGSGEEMRKTSGRPGNRKAFHIRFRFEPEITHSKEGLIEGWLSDEFIPVEGRIKDVSVVGDVRGALIEK